MCRETQKKPPPFERKRLSHNADIGRSAGGIRKVRYDQRCAATAGQVRHAASDATAGRIAADHSKTAVSRAEALLIIILRNPPQGREALVLQVFVCFGDPVTALGADDVLKRHVP